MKSLSNVRLFMSSYDGHVDHYIPSTDSNIHYSWSQDHEEALKICPGDIVEFDCRDASDGQIGPSSTVQDLKKMTWQGHPLTGPVYINNASPGDVLSIELLDMSYGEYGFTYFYDSDANKGLLSEDFDDPALYIWELGENKAEFINGIEIPIDPFPGSIGVAPNEEGIHSTTPPRNVGGNLDIKHLNTGSKLYLPIHTKGGMFSIGDCHAAQGDGEVCVTAIEAPMSVTVQFNLDKESTISRPQFVTSRQSAVDADSSRMFATTGINPSLDEASKEAVRGMIDHLCREQGLTREESYMLCSVAVDLKINQIVNKPNWTVSAYLPEKILNN